MDDIILDKSLSLTEAIKIEFFRLQDAGFSQAALLKIKKLMEKGLLEPRELANMDIRLIHKFFDI